MGGLVDDLIARAGFTSPVADRLTIIIEITPDLYAKNTDRLVVIKI